MLVRYNVLIQHKLQPVLIVDLVTLVVTKNINSISERSLREEKNFLTFSIIPASSLFNVVTICAISNHGFPSSVTVWNLKQLNTMLFQFPIAK